MSYACNPVKSEIHLRQYCQRIPYGNTNFYPVLGREHSIDRKNSIFNKHNPCGKHNTYSRHNLHKRHKSTSFYMVAGFFGVCFLTFIILFTFYVNRMSVEANSGHEQPRVKQFTSIQLEDGDTLWSISEQYRTEEYASEQEYIKEVKYINGITDDTIIAGHFIMIPYYTSLGK